MYHFSNDRMTRPKSRGDWVNSQRSGLWGTEQFPLSISSCPSAGFITDICTHWLHSRDRKLILHGLPFTGVQCALLRNLKMLEGTRFTSNLIQKLGRGCVCVCVCVCVCARTHVCVLVCILTQLCLTLLVRVCVCVCVCVCARTHTYSVVSDSLQPRGRQPARLLCLEDFSRQEYWSGLPFPSPGDLPDSGIEPGSPAL